MTYFNVGVSEKPTALFQSISLRMAANPSSRKRTNLAKKVRTDDKDQEILMNFKKQANYRERKKKENCEAMKWEKFVRSLSDRARYIERRITDLRIKINEISTNLKKASKSKKPVP